MQSKKHLEDLNVAILVPCYKRKEYTAMCIEALNEVKTPCTVHWVLFDDGSKDGTEEILHTMTQPNTEVVQTEENIGLREVTKLFFHNKTNFDVYMKIDNDCIVPENYLFAMLQKLVTTDADILSPNVLPSDASEKYGSPDTEGRGYRPSKIVGGLWVMSAEMISGLDIESHDVVGIKGATNILYQIVLEKDPNIGWVDEVVVQDIGHWSGNHPDNIKSFEHYEYYKEIGRDIAWGL